MWGLAPPLVAHRQCRHFTAPAKAGHAVSVAGATGGGETLPEGGGGGGPYPNARYRRPAASLARETAIPEPSGQTISRPAS